MFMKFFILNLSVKLILRIRWQIIKLICWDVLLVGINNIFYLRLIFLTRHFCRFLDNLLFFFLFLHTKVIFLTDYFKRFRFLLNFLGQVFRTTFRIIKVYRLYNSSRTSELDTIAFILILLTVCSIFGFFLIWHILFIPVNFLSSNYIYLIL